MFRGSLVFLAGAVAAAMMGQAPNQQGANGNVIGWTFPNVLDPLVFIPGDCDLNDDGKVDESDLREIQDQSPAYKEFKARLIEAVRLSAARIDKLKTTRFIRDSTYDKLARAIVLEHIPKHAASQDAKYHVLTYWDTSKRCKVSWDTVDQETFERIQDGNVFYELIHQTQRWKMVADPVKPVIVHLKPRNV